MARVFDDLSQILAHGYDAIIDVRSPAEFAEDHIPGAINLPVLSNAERAEVGTIYKQVSPFDGRKRGAAMVFANAARHIATLSDRPGDWRPLVYCWRGGQRSGAFAWMLREIGWRAEVIEGGYQSYRRLVHTMMYTFDLPMRLVLLDGYTGTAKTEILKHLMKSGVQVIDLEHLANHRGSLLGGCGPQPSQKAFESRIAMAVAGFDVARPVIVEAESNKIGARILPPSLWKAMQRAPRITVEATLDARARYLASAYADVLADTAALRDKLDPLRAHRGHAVVERWSELMRRRDKTALTAALIADHYDPAYDTSRARADWEEIGKVALADLQPGSIALAADHVMAVLDRYANTTPAPSVT